MKWRLWISGIVAAIAIIGIILLWRSARSREAAYDGRSLSYWVSELRLTVPQRGNGALTYSDIVAIKDRNQKLLIGPKEYPKSSETPAEAIRVIGTNALPFLLEELQREPSKLQQMLAPLLAKAGFGAAASNWRPGSFSFSRKPQVLTAIRLLGTNAVVGLAAFQMLTNSRHSDLRLAGELVLRGFSTNAPKGWFDPPL